MVESKTNEPEFLGHLSVYLLAVTLIGYNTFNYGGKEKHYWIIQNSWGSS